MLVTHWKELIPKVQQLFPQYTEQEITNAVKHQFQSTKEIINNTAEPSILLHQLGTWYAPYPNVRAHIYKYIKSFRNKYDETLLQPFRALWSLKHKSYLYWQSRKKPHLRYNWDKTNQQSNDRS